MPLPHKTAKELGFKVGDKFRVVKAGHSHFEVDDIITLKDDDGSDMPIFSGSQGEHICWFSRLAPITEPSTEPHRFKKGDRVRVTRPLSGSHIKIGWTGTVVGDDPYEPLVGFDNGNNFRIRWDRLELIDNGYQTGGFVGWDTISGPRPELQNCRCDIDMEISPNINTLSNKGVSIMSRLSLLAKKVFDKDTKTLIKAGVLDTDLNIQNEQFVLAFVVEQYKKELAALAQEQLDEAKTEK